MVGPISDEERSNAYRQLAIGFVVFVGLSSGLTAFWGDASLVEIVLVVFAGLIVGGGVLVAMGVGR
jgi:hypothetical protein